MNTTNLLTPISCCGEKLAIRCPRRMKLCDLITDNARKHMNWIDNVQLLYWLETHLDKVMELTASKMGTFKLSLLQHLNVGKANEPSRKKRKANQNVPKQRLVSTESMLHVMRKLAIKSAQHEKFNWRTYSHQNAKLGNDSVGHSSKLSHSLSPIKLENSKQWPNLVTTSSWKSSTDCVEIIEPLPESISVSDNDDDESDYLSALLTIPTDYFNKKIIHDTLPKIIPR